MCFNNGNNDCSCLWILLIIILFFSCGSWGGKRCDCDRDRDCDCRHNDSCNSCC